MWERGKHFLQRAGTVIFGAVVLIWFLGNMPWGTAYASAQSWLGRVGSFVAPVFIPCGFGQWPAVTSLISGFFTKETVVGTLGAVFSVEEAVLGGTLTTQLGWTPLIAFAFMVFSLLYTPCVAAIGTMRGETHSWKWPWFSIVYSTGIAWIAATLVYQIGRAVIGS
jgi:ferrous iron transport protein B